MGGCAPSKMPNGEDLTRKKSKFGFSGGSSTPSLNASQTRLKHLAVADDTYEIVGGGRVVAERNGHVTGVLDVMRDAGSQTLTTTTATNTTSDIQILRPTQFRPFNPRTGSRLPAPLATIETASELGTPTPMEENKAFIRAPGTSFLPQPGQQRPLLPLYGTTPARFAFTPKVPSSPVSAPPSTAQVAPLSTAQVAPPATQKSKAAIRPSGLSPRTATDTDNVLISTKSFALKPPSQSVATSGVPKSVGSVSSFNSVNSVRSVGKDNTSVEGVRAASTMSQKFPGEPVAVQKPQRHIDNDQKKLSPVTDDVLSQKKPAIPKPGALRTPISAGNPPRGPLANQQNLKSSSEFGFFGNGPAKPARKSPQSQSGTTNSSLRQVAPFIPDAPVNKGQISPKETEFRDPILSVKEDNAGLKSILSTRIAHPISTKFAMDECDSGSDIMDMNHVLDDDDSIFSEREALAEMPKVHRVTQVALEDMLDSLNDVRTLADDLLKLHESTNKVLLNGHEDGRKSPLPRENGTARKFHLTRERLEVLVRAPDEATLKDPLEARQLILDLQEAVLMLCDSHYNNRPDKSAF